MLEYSNGINYIIIKAPPKGVNASVGMKGTARLTGTLLETR